MQHGVLFIAKNSTLALLGSGIIARLGLPFVDAGTENHILMGLRRASYFQPNIIFLDSDLPYMGVSAYLDMFDKSCGPFRVLLYRDHADAPNVEDSRLTAVLGPDDLAAPRLRALLLLAADENERLHAAQKTEPDGLSAPLFEKLERMVTNPGLYIQLSGYFSVSGEETLAVLSFRPDRQPVKNMDSTALSGCLSPQLVGRANTFFAVFEAENRGCLITSQLQLCDQLLSLLSAIYGRDRFYYTRRTAASSVALGDCYRESCRRLEYAYFEPTEKCVDMLFVRPSQVPELDKSFISLLRAVLDGDQSAIIGQLDQIYLNDLRPTYDLDLRAIIRQHIRAVYTLVAEMCGSGQYPSLSMDYQYLTQEVIGVETIFVDLSAAVEHIFRGMSQYVLTALYMIHLYYGRSLTLGSIAQNTGISAPYLSTMFRNEIGITLKDYLAHIRTKQAMKLLRKSNLKIAEIAEQVGLPDARYFSRVFREHTGVTPTEYRNNGKEAGADVVCEIYRAKER